MATTEGVITLGIGPAATDLTWFILLGLSPSLDTRGCLTLTDALTFTLTATDALTFTLTATDAGACTKM